MAKRSKPNRVLRRATLPLSLPLSRATWMAARAKNAMRRPIFIGSLSVGAFVVALVSLVVVLPQMQRAAQRVAPQPSERVDTLAAVADVEVARVRLRAADDSLARSRAAAAAAFRAVAVDTLSPATIARRDTLESLAASLAGLIERAENAPLPTSYRALGDAVAAQGDAQVYVLMDSLTKIEREREAFGAVGSADPIFVALTSSANEIGRQIVTIAEGRRAQLRQQVAAITPKVETIPAELLAAADTAPRIAAAAVARGGVTAAEARLVALRQRALAIQAREEQAQRLATFSVPPLALLAAALVLGAVLGFGAAFLDEVRHPRLADAAEAERVTGLRVLGVVQPREAVAERSRRESDRAAPPQVDPAADAYQLVYLHVATASPGLLILTITGDDAAVPAIVAANLAAISSSEARHTLVIDGDAVSCGVAAVLHTRAEPGMIDLIDGRALVGEAITQATVGRTAVIDVLPSGVGVPLPEAAEVAALLQKEVGRLARRYDTVLVVTPESHAREGLPASLPSPDLLYCVRVGHSRVREIQDAVLALRRAGANPLGLIVWDTLPAALPTPTELTAGPRPQRTQEMPVMARA